jgi:hypothetical protein
MVMVHKSERKKTILEYARHYHSPVSDFKGFNKTLKENTGIKTTRKEVIKLLGY